MHIGGPRLACSPAALMRIRDRKPRSMEGWTGRARIDGQRRRARRAGAAALRGEPCNPGLDWPCREALTGETGCDVADGLDLAMLLGAWIGAADVAQASAGFSCSVEDKTLEARPSRAPSAAASARASSTSAASSRCWPRRRRTTSAASIWSASISRRPGSTAAISSCGCIASARATPPRTAMSSWWSRRGRAARDELEYAGSYVLTVFHLKSEQDSEGKTFTARGKAKCSAG